MIKNLVKEMLYTDVFAGVMIIVMEIFTIMIHYILQNTHMFLELYESLQN